VAESIVSYPYSSEISALERSGRFRERYRHDPSLVDLASNDYLGLARSGIGVRGAIGRLERAGRYAPAASMLVDGYHSVHEEFEEYIASLNRFESAVSVGSGFLANLSLVESLVRRGDTLVMDEEFHASGILASKCLQGKVEFFHHNDPEDLRRKISSLEGGRVVVAVEGVYSMGGDLLDADIFEVADEYGAILVVDEAHSSGVLGKNLTGVFEHYGIEPGDRHIKMGTLGKAYGSYGAYILASSHIVSYLVNRAKPIIYSTAPSLFDIALAHENMLEIAENIDRYSSEIERRREVTRERTGRDIESLIFKIVIGDDKRVIDIRRRLSDKGYLVGAIRRPTVDRAILRIIPGVGVPVETLHSFFDLLEEVL